MSNSPILAHLTLIVNLWSRCSYYPYFTDEETEAQKGQGWAVCLRLLSQLRVALGFDLGSLLPESPRFLKWLRTWHVLFISSDDVPLQCWVEKMSGLKSWPRVGEKFHVVWSLKWFHSFMSHSLLYVSSYLYPWDLSVIVSTFGFYILAFLKLGQTHVTITCFWLPGSFILADQTTLINMVLTGFWDLGRRY